MRNLIVEARDISEKLRQSALEMEELWGFKLPNLTTKMTLPEFVAATWDMDNPEFEHVIKRLRKMRNEVHDNRNNVQYGLAARVISKIFPR